MSYEVEQKFPAATLAEVEAKLHAQGARRGEELEQVDTYFSHPAHDFAETDEALRIRRVGSDNYITYKGPRLDAQTKTRREIELPLASGERAAADFAELLTALGFRRVTEVHKRRRTFRLEWQAHEIEAALDEVVGLGSFVEIETLADEQNLAAAKAAVQSLASQLDLGQSERRSYLELLLAKSGEK